MTSLVLCDASTLYLTVVIPYARDTIANAAPNANIVEGATSCTRPCGPMDKASVYGTGDSRFESWQGQFYLSSLRTRSMKENTIKTRAHDANPTAENGPTRARTADFTVISRTL